MVALNSAMVPLGTSAHDFKLPAVDGSTVALADYAPAPALLVMFICNHCPYVKHIESTLGATIAEYTDQGLAAVGICANDAAGYPDDSPEQLAAQAERAGFTFAYLVDEAQDVSRSYQAACTPDFFLYDADRKLAYRGAFDYSTPGNGKPVTGELLRAAMDHVLAGRPVPEPHQPSIGCNIKWRD